MLGSADEVAMRSIAMLTLLIVVAASAGVRFGADHAARAEFAGLAHDGLSVANITANPWRHIATIEGLTLHRAPFSVHVGRVRLPFTAQSLFTSPAYAEDVAAPTGTISAEDIVIDIGPMHYTIENITLSGASFSKADLTSLFDPKSTVSVADQLAKFSAAQITIPEIAMQARLGGKSENDSYRDVVLTGVVNGRAGKVAIGTLTSDAASPDAGTVEATYGPIMMTGLDLALAAKVVSERRQDDSEPLNTLYDGLEINNGKIVLEKSQIEIDVGTLSAKDMKARALRVPPVSAAALVAAPDSDPKAEAFVADAIDSFAVGTIDVANLRIIVTDKDAAGTGTIGSIHLSQIARAMIADADLADLAVKAGDSSVKIGALSFHDIDLGALRGLAQTTPQHGSSASIASEIEATTVDVDAVEAKAEGDRRTRFQLGKLGLVSADPVDGMPTHFSTSLDHFTFDPKDAGGELKQAIALGYDKIDLSSRLEAHFDAGKQELRLDDLSLSGIDMGAVKIACTFGNVSKDLFSSDQAQIEAAALSVLVHRIEIKVENAGLFERVIAAAAKQENESPEQVRQAYVAAAAIGIPTLLGNGPAAKAIGAAVAKFVAAPKNLHIVAVAPQGLGAADFLLIKEPGALMSKLLVEAAANE
jgi:hypothetical protein